VSSASAGRAASFAAREKRSHIVIQPSSGLRTDIRELWQYRELAWFLLLRTIKPRYRQTLLGVGWAVIPPFVLMVAFSLFFNQVANVPSAPGVPYPIFSYAGLLAWQFFQNGTTRGAGSLLANANFLTKVYFPRVLIPLAAVLSAAFDLAVSLLVLVPLFAYYEFTPDWHLVAMPAFVLIAAVLALGLSLWLAASSVRFRDLGIAVPLLMQVWLFATPVIYPSTLLPDEWQTIVAALNPMVAVVEGVRWSLVGTGMPPLWEVGCAAGIALLVTLGGLAFFAAMEGTYADEI
jgi:lipopolysaccharide transport system permease protein